MSDKVLRFISASGEIAGSDVARVKAILRGMNIDSIRLLVKEIEDEIAQNDEVADETATPNEE